VTVTKARGARLSEEKGSAACAGRRERLRRQTAKAKICGRAREDDLEAL
jgi:hypothetical protein